MKSDWESWNKTEIIGPSQTVSMESGMNCENLASFIGQVFFLLIIASPMKSS